MVDNFDLGYLLPEELLLVATGSQGETGAALQRLAADSHPDVNLSAGDHVIFSTMTIPGNEQQVNALVAAFRACGITVTQLMNPTFPCMPPGHCWQSWPRCISGPARILLFRFTVKTNTCGQMQR